MMYKFESHVDALEFAKKNSEALHTRVWILSIFIVSLNKLVTFVFGPSSLHLAPVKSQNNPSLSCYDNCFKNWWFGGPVLSTNISEVAQFVDNFQEIPPLPDDQEWWYNLAAGTSQGYTHEQLKQVAEGCVKNAPTCVWHEFARLHNKLETCDCMGCQRKKGKKDIYGNPKTK